MAGVDGTIASNEDIFGILWKRRRAARAVGE